MATILKDVADCLQDIENIFSNILDVQALTYNLLSSLEDTKEMCEETDIPLIGACFEDIAEVTVFGIPVSTVWYFQVSSSGGFSCM